MKSILSLIISTALVVSGYGQTRNVLVGTNNAVVQPTNFWSADASNARSGLGLGSAATNLSSAFQPSSATLSNLASSNAINLTNVRATNLVGLIPSSNIPTTLTNITGTLSITQGGTGATNSSGARASLELGTAATNPSSAFQPSSTVLSNLASSNGGNLTNITISNVTGLLATNGNGAGLTNLTAANITGTVALASNVTGTIAISNGGSGATNAGGARTNLGLGETNALTFQSVSIAGASQSSAINLGNSVAMFTSTNNQDGVTFAFTGSERAYLGFDGLILYQNGGNLAFGTNNTSGAATTRTNLGLGWSALTNSNAGTGLVSVNTNGEVVSPTNFWQNAPSSFAGNSFQNFNLDNVNATNNATNVANLLAYSIASSVTGITNTINLPTNGSSGNIATIVHTGPTSSVTAIRQTGAGTNLITLNKTGESVRFVYNGTNWSVVSALSFTDPIYFSGTNAAANAAASRTNLGLGAAWLTNTNVTNFRTAIGLGATNDVALNSLQLGGGTNTALFIVDEQTILGDGVLYLEAGQMIFKTPIEFNNTTNAATTRTNLGLGLPALTNTSNVIVMRALSGSTNTNHPYSGSISVVGTNNTNTLIFSNGILQSVTTP